MKAKIETSQGEIIVDLFEREAPKTVRNFQELSDSGFYTDLLFHRIVKDFVVQTGDPTTKNGGGTRTRWGMGGSLKTIPLEVDNSLCNSVGTLGMARSSDPDSASSQFYINLSDNKPLDGKYAVFGKVTSGMQVIYSIANLRVDRNDAPLEVSGALLRSISMIV